MMMVELAECARVPSGEPFGLDPFAPLRNRSCLRRACRLRRRFVHELADVEPRVGGLVEVRPVRVATRQSDVHVVVERVPTRIGGQLLGLTCRDVNGMSPGGCPARAGR